MPSSSSNIPEICFTQFRLKQPTVWLMLERANKVGSKTMGWDHRWKVGHISVPASWHALPNYL